MQNLWSFMVIGGPIILLVALIYAMVRTSRRKRSLHQLSEEGTRALRREIERDPRGD